MRTLLILTLFVSMEFDLLAERQVRVRAFVTVTGRSVMLKDLLIDTKGLSEEELNYRILESPLRGYKKYNSRDLAYMMQEHESLMDLSLLAPARIKISRKPDTGFVAKVRDELKAQLLDQPQWKGHTIDLDFNTEDIIKINEKVGGEVILLSQTPNQKLDRVEMRVSFTDGKAALGSIEVNAYIRRKVFTVILSKDVVPGQIIRKEDLKLAQVWSDGKEERYLRDFKQCVGQQVTRSMVADSRILKKNLSAPFYARKGEIISVNARIGRVVVSVHAQALRDGKRGQVISAKNTKSGQIMDVRMVSLLIGEVQ